MKSAFFNCVKHSLFCLVNSSSTLSLGKSSARAAHPLRFFMRYAAVLIMLVTLSVGNAWGDTETLTLSDFGWSNGTAQTSMTATSATIAMAKNSASTAPTYYTSDGLRLYGVKNTTTGCSIAFTAKTGITITGITFTHTSTNSGVLSASTGSYSSKAWSGSLTAGNTVTFKTTNTGTVNSNPQVRITKIVITYTAAASCTTSPTVTAGGNSSVTSTTATVSCSSGISSLGSAGCSITSYGFVIGTSTNPSIGGSGVTKHEVGTSYTTTGTSFSKDLTGLTASTTYYVRPYATNGNGTAYGTQTSFTTSAPPKYTVTLKDDNSTLTQASAGASVTLPSRAGCSGYTFAGWSTTNNTSWTTTAPTIINAGSYTPTADINLYPVYTKTEGGGSITDSYGFEEASPTNWTIGSQPSRNNSNAHTGSYAGYINTNNTYVTFNEKVKVTAFSFWLKRTSTNSNYNVYVETSTDGSTWTAAATYSMSSFGNGSYTQQTKTWDGTTAYYVRFHCYNTTAVRYVDDISITYAGGSTTSYISVPNCCTELGTISGSADATGSETTLTVKNWSAVSNVTSYTVKLYKKNDASWDLVTGTATGGASGAQGTRTGVTDRTTGVTWSGMTYGATYKVTVQAIGTGDYCDGAETAIATLNSTPLSSNEIPWKYSIYIDNGSNAGYAHHDIASLTSHVGSVDVTSMLANQDYYQYKLCLGHCIWWGNTGKMTSANCTNWTFSSGANNCKLQTALGGTYTFTVNAATPAVSVVYPLPNQPSNRSIWFDKSVITGWNTAGTADIFYRIGHTTHNTNNSETGGTAWTLVTGTDRFYTTKTMAYDGFDAWQIANNKSWSGSGNSIYLVNGSGYAITKATNFIKELVGTSGVTVVPTTTNNTEDGCNYWNVSVTEGMLTHTATITTPSNGTIHIEYTNTSGTAQDKTATTSGLAHRTILTVSAVPSSGYQCTALTVNGAAFTSGNTHILAADATIAATFERIPDQFVDLVHGTVVPNQTSTYTITSITIPDQSAVSTGTCGEVHYHFVGWITKAKHDAGTTISAGDIQTGSKTPAGNTFYAVWAKEVLGGTASYDKITAIGDLADGDYLIVCEDENVAFDGAHDPLDASSNYVSVTISSNSITYTSDLATRVFTITTSSSNKLIKSKSDLYIGNSSNTNGLTASAYEQTNTISFSSGNADIVSSGGAYLRFNPTSGQTRFRYFKSSTYTAQSAIQLYKYNPGVSFGDYVSSCGATYTITLNKNGGTTNGTATVTENAAQLNAGFTPPVWAGHQVEGYYTTTTCDTKIATAEGVLQNSITVSGTPWTDANGKWVKGGNATFYAKWEAQQCVITLNNVGADSGHEGTASVTATYGANTNLTTSITKPEKTGYDFGGYYTEPAGAGTQLIDANGAWLASKTGYTDASRRWQLDAATLTLYAKWTIKTYTVNWYVNGVSVATETSVPHGRLYSALTNEPDVADNALSSCNSTKFIGWVTTEGQYTTDGGTKTAQYDPYAVIGSTTITEDTKDFHAMFAEESGGTTFTLDGSNGSTQEGKIFVIYNGQNYYMTGSADNSTSSTTTDPGEANTYTFTKVSNGVYKIKKGTKWLNKAGSDNTKFKEENSAINWNISEGINGSWRIQSSTYTSRAIIGLRSPTTGDVTSVTIGTYATSNTTQQPSVYKDVEIGGGSLINYRTGCCSEKITLSVTGATNGTYTLKFNNVAQTSGAIVSTCATSTVEFKITANVGYTLTNMSISGTNKTLTITPSPITTGLPSTSEMTYSVSIPALATGTLTITPTFAQTYTATYDLAGGETAGSTATARYTSGTSVTLVTPDPTRTGYNFTGWTINKAGGGTVTPSAGAFTMPAANVTVVAGWTAKPLTSLTVDPTTATVYVGQYVQIPITYDPADILTKGYTLVSTPAYCITTGSTNTTLKITGGRGGVTITEDKVETVSIKADADNTKRASVTVTVKPLPVDHFIDLIHGETFADQSSSIVDNALSANYSAPGHEDVDEPVSGNTCEKQHLHLVGWIESEWADAHLTATMSEIKNAKDAELNPLFHAVYSSMTASNKTYYAVWGHEVTP